VKKRSTYEMPWLEKIVPFSTFKGKHVLELGCGAGYDAYEFCRNGTHYTGIDITPENIKRAKLHLSFYGFSPVLQKGDAENIQFVTNNFDIVFSNGVLHHTPDISKSFQETKRVLKDGGEFWVILYHKNSIFYWLTLFLFDHIFRLGFLKRSFKERLAMIEYTTSEALPLVNVYSRNELKRLLIASGFEVETIWIRKLVKEDMPGIPLISPIWKYIPQRVYDKIGEYVGWYIIAKAIKRNEKIKNINS